jgi:hypothetical protein
MEDRVPGGLTTPAWSKKPRTKAERRRDVLRLLASENKLWIATASRDGHPHMIALSFVWYDGRVTMATRAASPTVRNARDTGRARLALGAPLDVVLIDGSVVVSEPLETEPDVAEALRRVAAVDPMRSPGFAYMHLTPYRIQAYWTMIEKDRPTIMRQGTWVG